MLSGVLTARMEKSETCREFRNKFDEIFGSETSSVRAELKRIARKLQLPMTSQR